MDRQVEPSVGTLSSMLAVGVDVAEERKGLDLVALDSSHRVVTSHRRLTLERVANVILSELHPDIVCIDSPSGWSLSGASRQAERDLARLRISAFATGTDPGDHRFYRWMRVGFSVFAAVASRYPLFRGGNPLGQAAEVFPNASAVMLAGRARSKYESKLQFRRQVLLANHVDVKLLKGIDQVDAALAALTGVVALEGQWHWVGDPDEGVILLPIQSAFAMPSGIATAVEPPACSEVPAVDRRCGCGCGALVRRRFLPGHDARLKSRLLAAWRAGDSTAEDKLRLLRWLPDSNRSDAP